MLRRQSVKTLLGLSFAAVLGLGGSAALSYEVRHDAASTTVVDMAGRTVTLPKDIRRLATVGGVPPLNIMVYVIGKGDLLINKLPMSFSEKTFRMHYAFAPQIKDAPNFQSHSMEILPENLLKGSPDLVITNFKSMIKTIEKLNIPVIYIGWGGEKEVFDSISFLADIFSTPETAKEFEAYQKATMEEIRSISSKIPPEKRQTVLFSNPNTAKTPGVDTEKWLADVGAKSVTAEASAKGMRQYTMEDILIWKPDAIYVTYSTLIPELKNNPLLKDVPAVKNDKIILVPIVGHKFGGYTAESPAAAWWMIHKLYPDVVSKEKAAEKIKDFYRKFFKYELSDPQIDWIFAGADS
jgi:iron complex transport system substrate-binding protein